MKRAAALLSAFPKINSSHFFFWFTEQQNPSLSANSLWIKTHKSKSAVAGPGASWNKKKWRQSLYSAALSVNRVLPSRRGHIPLSYSLIAGTGCWHLRLVSAYWMCNEDDGKRPSWMGLCSIMNDSVSYCCLTSHEIMWKVAVWTRLQCSERILWSILQRKAIKWRKKKTLINQSLWYMIKTTWYDFICAFWQPSCATA